MNFTDVQATLLDLPATFTRQQAWFTQLIDATTLQLALETNSANDIMAQVTNFANAQDGWIDLWGLLFGIPRNQGEGNNPYSLRITETVLAVVGTIPAIQIWLNLFAPGGTVAEKSPGPGYIVTLPSAMTTAQIAAFVVTLNRVRPIGVPFSIIQGTGALYLGTFIYAGLGSNIGNYMSNGTTSAAAALAAVTLSFAALLPTLMFVDPILNPGLAPALALP